MKLVGKVAVVTGAASGIGRAIALRFAEEGAKVVVSDVNYKGIQGLVQEIEEKDGVAKGLKVDVSKRDEVEEMIDTAVETFGTLDILVNNAGIMDRMEPIGDVDDDNWDLIFDVNVKSVMMASRKAISIFLEKEDGVIINIASTGGLNGGNAGAIYTATKHAVVGLTKNTAYMYTEKGIRCNGIAPGAVETNIVAGATDIHEFGVSRTGKTHSLVPRSGDPREIANIALFLASEESSFVNGDIIVADAAWTAAF